MNVNQQVVIAVPNAGAGGHNPRAAAEEQAYRDARDFLSDDLVTLLEENEISKSLFRWLAKEKVKSLMDLSLFFMDKNDMFTSMISSARAHVKILN